LSKLFDVFLEASHINALDTGIIFNLVPELRLSDDETGYPGILIEYALLFKRLNMAHLLKFLKLGINFSHCNLKKKNLH
jgi:hypothetical protein